MGNEHIDSACLRYDRLGCLGFGQRRVTADDSGSLLREDLTKHRPHELGGLRDEDSLSDECVVHGLMTGLKWGECDAARQATLLGSYEPFAGAVRRSISAMNSRYCLRVSDSIMAGPMTGGIHDLGTYSP